MKRFIILLIMLFGITGCAKPYIETDDNDIAISKEITEKLDTELIVHFLDVGQGDSIFIELPNNKSMIIDAGEDKYSSKIIDYIKNLGYDKIDYVIGTHPHADHIGGLGKVIEEFDIGTIYMPKVIHNSKTYENLLTTILNKNLKIKTAIAGLEIINEENLNASIVAPNSTKYSSLNNYSIVLKLVYGNTSYIFTGDAEELSENEITLDIKSDVLKVGHHGSNTSTSEKFLSEVAPKYAIISVGDNNSYNHPSDSTIKKLKKYTNNIYRTDLNGTIIIKSDGENLNVTLEKE